MNSYIINWIIDGKIIKKYYPIDSIPTYDGIVDKLPDKIYNYQFIGWDANDDNIVDYLPDDILPTLVQNTSYKAIYSSTFIEYIIEFYDLSNELLSKTVYHYGDTVTQPIKPKDYSNNTFKFEYVWNKEVSLVNNNESYYLVLNQTYVDYMIDFYDLDGKTLISRNNYHYEDIVIQPQKPDNYSDNTFNYVYTWDKDISIANKNESYYLVCNKTYIDYVIDFYDIDGMTLLNSNTYHYGDTLIQPQKPNNYSDKKYSYEYVWDKEITTANTNKAYYLKCNSTYIDYIIRFYDDDGSTLIKESIYHYGEEILKPNNPSKNDTTQYLYQFDKWDDYTEGMTVSDSANFVAKYQQTIKQYTYKFYDRNNNLLSSKTDDYGALIIAPTIDPVIIEKINKYTFVNFSGYSNNMVLTEDVEFIAVYTKSYLMSETELNTLINDFGLVTFNKYDQLYSLYNIVKEYKDIYAESYSLCRAKVDEYNNLVKDINNDNEESMKAENHLFGSISSLIKLNFIQAIIEKKEWWQL